jgi:acyl-homoserine lactone acylase PvdQ
MAMRPSVERGVGDRSSLDRATRDTARCIGRRRGFAAGACLLTLLLAGACRRGAAPAPPLVPDVSGTREIAGLSAPVRIVRDRWGVPHIYAATADDLFFAQGFVQAQDRLFQMDLWRRSSLGRLAEVLGPNFAERDAMTRRVQYAGAPDAEWNSYAAGTRAIAAAFVRGINAWVALARARPPEEFVLAGWKPEPWVPEDLLNRTDAFVESRDAIDKIFRARVIAALGRARAAAVLPRAVVDDLPRDLDPAVVSGVVADAIRSVGTAPFFLGLAVAAPPKPRAAGDARPADIPLDIRALPVLSARYLVHLNAPGWNVAGATAAWLPGVAVGHNDSIAWDMTPAELGAQDVYVERLNPDNPHQVEFRGRWVDTNLAKEPLIIRGRDQPLVFDRERTRHGAILAVDRARHLAFTVRWVGTEPGAAGDLIALEIDRASDSAAVRAALSRWKLPARSVSYRDRSGQAHEIAGVVPNRQGWKGTVPAPGWTGANEWTGLSRQVEAGAEGPMGVLARRRPDRADALIRDLTAAATGPNWPTAASALVVNALADALKQPAGPVLFTHPLAISEATRARFNIGPVPPPPGGARPFAVSSSLPDWDRSTAMNAPGQSGSPAGAHYGDLVGVWRDGQSIPLPFSERAVAASAASTLTLTPPRAPAAR